jgi:AraC-like DNA-binding protein/mannose-6-phosphate isomerase-like protein (cupin superfamily)
MTEYNNDTVFYKMKAQLLKIPKISDGSFTVREFKQSNINSKWHYHPEIELIRIHHGTGTQFMGDNIKRFEADDIILVGCNLPHFWRYDEELHLSEETLFSTVIHFSESLWGKDFMDLPENFSIKNMFEKSKRGLLLKGNTRNRVAALMEKIKISEGTYRLIYLLESILIISLGNVEEVMPLSSIGFENQSSIYEHERINMIYDYSFKNFKDRIPLETIASKIGLAPSSFCRYFKSKTGKSYTDFILELRVGHACKLLHENKLNVKQICYESGFNNFSSFHKHFKAITGLSPQNYQKLYFCKIASI